MKNKNKKIKFKKLIARSAPNRLLMSLVVLGIGLFGAYQVASIYAKTPYKNPYKCTSSSSVHIGSSGACVKYLQYTLNGSGASPVLKVDGDYGSKTKKAVQKFQYANSVPDSGCLKSSGYTSCDGIVGSKTWTKVRALDLSLESSSKPKPVVKKDKKPVGAISCESATTSTITVKIKYLYGQTPATIYRDDSKKLASLSSGTTATKVTDSGLEAGKSYNYRLKLANGVLGNRSCRTANIVTSSKILTPTGLSFSDVSPKDISVQWKPIEGATGYIVRYSTSSKLNNAGTQTVASPTVRFDNLTPATAYYFQVYAYNGKDRSAWSKAVTKTTLPHLDFTIATFNMAYEGFDHVIPGHNWADRKSAVEQILKINNFDIFGAQEIWSKNQFNDLASMAKAYNHTNFEGSQGVYRNPVYFKSSSFSLVKQGSFPLYDENDAKAQIQKFAVWAQLRSTKTGKIFYVFNAHFTSHNVEARIGNANKLIAGINQVDTEHLPLVLMGDFNSDRTDAGHPYALITGAGFVDSKKIAAQVVNGEYNSYHDFGVETAKQSVQFDKIYTRWGRNVTVAKYKVIIDKPGGVEPSDHNPVMVAIGLDF